MTDIETCHISKKAMIDLTGNVTLGRYCLIEEGARIYTHYHVHEGKIPLLIKERIRYKSKVIRDDVWIYSAIILPQCAFIAKGVIIGAGAVVTKSIRERYSIWAGNPARKIGTR